MFRKECKKYKIFGFFSSKPEPEIGGDFPRETSELFVHKVRVKLES